VERLSSLQSLLYASDATPSSSSSSDGRGGKDGVIKHVMSGVNPQGCQVSSFQAPEREELDHDFLWRTTRFLPERGASASQPLLYEEVLIVRVHRRSCRAKSCRRAHRPPLDLGGAVSLDRRAGGPPEPKRNAHPQVLPASFEGGTAQALPRAHRRPAQELEIQPRRRRGKKILEGYMKAYEACVRKRAASTHPGTSSRRRQAPTPG